MSNPYPGLRPFKPGESHLFFGREDQTDELLRRLRRTRFLAVLGTSGSGKSSLVQAALLPSLQGGMMAGGQSDWQIALFRPGTAPIENLAVALSPIPDEAIRTEVTLRRGALGLIEHVAARRLDSSSKLLIVADQFEELFRFMKTGAEDAHALVKLLLEAAAHPSGTIYVVLTMRSDYLGDCAVFPDLPDTINNGLYLIPRMTRDQRRRAIVNPARVGGAGVSNALIQRLLNDSGESPDQLPILQHALMRTWNQWVDDHKPDELLDLRHYRAVGMMTNALAKHAEEAYAEAAKQHEPIIDKCSSC